MSSHLVPTTPATSWAAHREISRIDRGTSRDVAAVRARAYVVAEKGRADAHAIEHVAVDAMGSGTQIGLRAAALVQTCPIAEPLLRTIVEQSGLALGQVVSDCARDLR